MKKLLKGLLLFAIGLIAGIIVSSIYMTYDYTMAKAITLTICSLGAYVVL